MRLFSNVFLLLNLICLTGCGSITYERSRFDGNRLSNPTLGKGVYYRLPETYSVLNPWAPVPTKRENAPFEGYLRTITAATNQPPTHHAFRESFLFRSENRYLWIYHASLNLPGTLNSLHPAQRKLLYPDLAASAYRYFDVPQSDFDYSVEQVRGRSIISYKPFRVDHPSLKDSDWRGIGFTVMGDVTDIMDVKIFAREAELPAARAEIQSILDGMSYGKPLP